MRLNVMIIDDFYTDPQSVRETALKLDYPPRPENAPWPGVTSRQSMLPPETDRMFSQILREPVVAERRAYHGRVRVSTAGAARGGVIHIDPGCVWAGLIYLSRDEDIPHDAPKGCGTEFYRHRATGTDAAPLTDAEALAKFGVADRGAAVDQIVERDGGDLSRWDHIWTAPMRFNRCVLFRPWLWHTSGVDFGDRPENARIVQLLFFKTPPAGAEPAVRRR